MTRRRGSSSTRGPVATASGHDEAATSRVPMTGRTQGEPGFSTRGADRSTRAAAHPTDSRPAAAGPRWRTAGFRVLQGQGWLQAGQEGLVQIEDYIPGRERAPRVTSRGDRDARPRPGSGADSSVARPTGLTTRDAAIRVAASGSRPAGRPPRPPRPEPFPGTVASLWDQSLTPDRGHRVDRAAGRRSAEPPQIQPLPARSGSELAAKDPPAQLVELTATGR